MGITAARGLAAAAAAAGYLVLGSCTPVGAPGAPPAPEPGPPVEAPEPIPGVESPDARPEPAIRVGLAVAVTSATLGGATALVVSDPAGARLAMIPAGERWQARMQGVGLAVVSPAGSVSTPAEALVITGAAAGDPVLVNGRAYRGTVDVIRAGAGITVVNRLGMEAYLEGVVSAEMGRRSIAEREALRAQAVVSRTYAHRNLRRWAAQGFDVYASVADQVYGGLSAETPEGREAVESTRGRVLTWGGVPIDAFFYSTCGGRTADGPEVFRAANPSYLHSVPDVDESGTAYCAISPRYRWREEWTGAALLATLRRTLPEIAGTPASQVTAVRDVWVVSRTPSGRVGGLAVALPSGQVRIDGPRVRGALRSASGELLRSNAFELTVTRAAPGVTRLLAEGGGAGHGVGFCQWGAVGRSRVGHDFQRILAAYYPGVTIQRFY